MPLTLISPAFADGERIPTKYARDGENLMPPLKWTGVPEKAASLVLIVEDPDAPRGTFRHLGLFNMPATMRELPESFETKPANNGPRFAKNDFGHARYDGPQPPPGHGVHHYHFRLGALGVASLSVPEEIGIEGLWKAASRHLIEETELIGTYER